MELVYVKSFADMVQEKAYGGEGKALLARMQALEVRKNFYFRKVFGF